MTAPELRDQIYMAVKLSYGRLPQLKGKGALRDPMARERALRFFADQIADRMLASNAVVLKGPPTAHHTTNFGA